MKSSMYRNLAVITCTLGLLGLVAGCLGVSVSFEPDQPEILSKLTEQQPILDEKTDSPAASNTEISPSTPSITNKTNKPPKPISNNPGSLRISNQTNQPVRIALLTRHSQLKSSSSSKIKDHIPAHWDFDPQEGSQRGLILSLPEGNLKLKKGDVLVAFAQDGSRKYWGPYIVGETSSPTWNSQTQEWQLNLTP
jgi:hypothetical protein